MTDDEIIMADDEIIMTVNNNYLPQINIGCIIMLIHR